MFNYVTSELPNFFNLSNIHELLAAIHDNDGLFGESIDDAILETMDNLGEYDDLDQDFLNVIIVTDKAKFAEQMKLSNILSYFVTDYCEEYELTEHMDDDTYYNALVYVVSDDGAGSIIITMYSDDVELSKQLNLFENNIEMEDYAQNI